MNREVKFRVTEAAGCYVHWPFCARKCPYCDFYTFGREHPDFDQAGRYAEALLAEIRGGAGRGERRARIDTIYLGGGTPSLIEPAVLGEMLDALRDRFEVEAGAEVTLEVNPTAAEAERLGAYRELGVNRLSIGCQSFQEKFLRLLGRDHDAAEARRAPALARSLGYDNLSIDLMFGLPEQTLAEFEADVEAAMELEPEHLSAYGLTLHEGTPYARWDREGRWRRPEMDEEAAMFELLLDRLAVAGYEHYEISNWARPGRASRHNRKYWSRCDVHAFGASAHGVLGGRRYSNVRDLRRYLDTAGGTRGIAQVEEEPPQTERARGGEIMMLALRRTAGVGWEEINAWLGGDAREIYREELAMLGEEGLIGAGEEGLRLTRRGLLLADRVMGEFF